MKLDFEPKLVPLFPLTGALLLPNSKLPLNIFEPRYIEMIKDSLKTDHRLIGMIQPLDNQKNISNIKDVEKLYKVGCTGRITSFDELEDSRYAITLTGFRRFTLLELQQKETSYFVGKIDCSVFPIDIKENTLTKDAKIDSFLNIISDYFSYKNISTDWGTLKSADQETLINSLSILCPFESYEKQALLEAYSIMDRKQVLMTLMEISSQKQGNDVIH